MGKAGTQTAALAFGGANFDIAPPYYSDATEEYDGSTWTTSPASMNTARGFLASAGAGTQTAALAFGGQPVTAVTESYNGITWTTVNSLNTPRQQLAGSGTQTAALAFAGVAPGPALTGATEEYDGTSWTNSPASLSVARYALSSSGTQASALAFGGKKAPTFQGSTDTEEWTGSGVGVTKTITVS